MYNLAWRYTGTDFTNSSGSPLSLGLFGADSALGLQQVVEYTARDVRAGTPNTRRTIFGTTVGPLATPEPATWFSIAGGMGLLAFRRRRKST